MFKNKRDLFNIGLLVIFIWLLITSYGSSKRKPENVGELFNDFSWLSDWPKWLDLPLICLLYTSPSPRDRTRSRMPSSA